MENEIMIKEEDKSKSAREILSDFTSIVNSYSNVFIEKERTAQIKVACENQKDMRLAEIMAEVHVNCYLISETFKDRRASINKSFEIIDKGLKENNIEYIKEGLNAVTKVVNSDPVRSWYSMNGEQRAQAIEDGSLCL